MRIGELADRSGVTTKTIRYWEDRGLIAAPERTGSGYRDYPADTEHALSFVRNAQAAGFTLAEISGILAIRAAGEPPCAHVTELINRHLKDIDERMRELRRLRTQLRDLAARAETLTKQS